MLHVKAHILMPVFVGDGCVGAARHELMRLHQTEDRVAYGEVGHEGRFDVSVKFEQRRQACALDARR